MSSLWLILLKFALNVALAAVAQIKPEQWATLGTVITAWIQALEDKLPVGHPFVAAFNSYRAPRSKLARFRPETDDE